MKNTLSSLKNSQSLYIGQVLFVLGIVFVAFNLRPSLTAVGPLIDTIRVDLQISSGVAGLITTLPLLAFAIMSPIAPKIGSRLGIERAIFAGIIVLLVGILIRSVSWTAALFIGTTLIGLGIAISNVLLPGLVKDRFPSKIGLITGVYTMSMGISAAIASGISVPLAQDLGLGWQNSLLFWAGLAFVTLMFWIPQIIGRDHTTKETTTKEVTVHLPDRSLWKSKIAWQVTFFMGFQSLLFYCMLTWLPAILHSHGMDLATAGWMLAIMQFIGLAGNLAIPILASRFTQQKWIAVTISAMFFIGLCGLLVGGHPLFLVVYTIFIGLGQGAGIALALTLFGLRAKNPTQAAHLSGMAQSIGYLLAAMGPFFIGAVFDLTQSWIIPVLLLLCAAVLQAIAGYGAGKNQYV